MSVAWYSTRAGFAAIAPSNDGNLVMKRRLEAFGELHGAEQQRARRPSSRRQEPPLKGLECGHSGFLGVMEEMPRYGEERNVGTRTPRTDKQHILGAATLGAGAQWGGWLGG